MATLSSILAWNTPWTEESGELQSTGSQRIKHDLATKQQQQSPCKDLIILHHPTSFPSNTVWIFNHRESCVIICHKAEGKPLMNGDLVTHYFVCHIPKHWIRPKVLKAQEWLFWDPSIKIQLFTTSSPNFQIISLLPPEAAVMVSHHSRKGYPITHLCFLFANYTRQSIFPT